MAGIPKTFCGRKFYDGKTEKEIVMSSNTALKAEICETNCWVLEYLRTSYFHSKIF